MTFGELIGAAKVTGSGLVGEVLAKFKGHSLGLLTHNRDHVDRFVEQKQLVITQIALPVYVLV